LSCAAAAAARDAAATAARHGYGKLVALLAARTRDVAGAEDALGEAFTSALVEWPARGVPRSPEAWLLTVARRRQIDAGRRLQRAAEGSAHVRLMAEEVAAAAATERAIPDERLALMFACAHPAIDAALRAPLILQTLLGFDAAAIGSIFLVSPGTMAQRLVRAKHKIREAGIPLRVPEAEELPARLGPVLEAIYAAFVAGGAARRNELSGEAIWLGRLLVSLLPGEAEALDLLASMLYADAQCAALVDEAEALLARSRSLPGACGRFRREAVLQSAHAARRKTGCSGCESSAGILLPRPRAA
jgi:RNA polymerase sigma-70 factor (ECF subfamily)